MVGVLLARVREASLAAYEQHHGRHAGLGNARGVVEWAARQSHVGSLELGHDLGREVE